MTKHQTPQRTWRRRWPLLGLMLVLLILGHDALMASEVLAATPGPELDAHHIPVSPVSPGHEHVLPAHHDALPQPPHPEQCHVGFEARVRSASDAPGMGHLPRPVALVAAMAAPTSVLDHAATWEEPHWPPGTRRALTQVYRI